jgi:hypothetical protein
LDDFESRQQERRMNRFRSDIELRTLSARYFTPLQAGASLVLVRRVVGDIVGGYGRLVELQETLEALQARQSRHECEAIRRQLIATMETLQSCLGELEEVGVELVDWALGIVEFPCLWSGREIRLTWQHGQRAITHWREIAESPTSRQPISSLLMEQMAVVGARR